MRNSKLDFSANNYLDTTRDWVGALKKKHDVFPAVYDRAKAASGRSIKHADTDMLPSTSNARADIDSESSDDGVDTDAESDADADADADKASTQDPDSDSDGDVGSASDDESDGDGNAGGADDDESDPSSRKGKTGATGRGRDEHRRHASIAKCKESVSA